LTPAFQSDPLCNVANATTFRLPATELAKVDPSVSVLCDVHNTLVNTVLRKYATKEIQDKYLPDLATSKVCPRIARATREGRTGSANSSLYRDSHSSVLSVFLNLLRDQMLLLYRRELSSRITAIISSTVRR
jgi:hypothetical protein